MTAYYNEIDPYAAQWLRNLITAGHIAPGDVDERSIADVQPADLGGYDQCHFFAGIGGWSLALRIAGWPDNRPVWTGSCPCQPFSLAGAQKGFADDRHLWPTWRDLIAKRCPSVVFGEQVASAAQWLKLVRSDLEALGYAVGAMPIQAACAGADHLRDRFWFVGHRGSTGLAFGSIAEVERGNIRHEGPAAAPSGDRGLTLADTDLLGSGEEREQRGRQQRGAGGDQEACGGSDLADAGSRRLCGEGERQGEQPRGAEAVRSGDTGRDVANALRDGTGRGSADDYRPQGAPVGLDGGSPWAGASFGLDGQDFEWVRGADGKARRVKSGLRLLAHDVPARVGKLRAFGNAIVPQVAAAFIAASIER